MAGANRYKRAAELLKTFDKKTLTMNNIRRLIIMNLGSDEQKCVQPYLRIMIETGLIKETEHLKFLVTS